MDGKNLRKTSYATEQFTSAFSTDIIAFSFMADKSKQ